MTPDNPYDPDLDTALDEEWRDPTEGVIHHLKVRLHTSEAITTRRGELLRYLRPVLAFYGATGAVARIAAELADEGDEHA